jgi:hypothetical protein
MYESAPKPGDGSLRGTADKALMPELLARERDWKDGLRSPGFDRFIASCSAIEVWVKAPALSKTALAPRLRLVQPVDEMPLVIRLAQIDFQIELAGAVFHPARNVVQRVRAVDFRLARAPAG